MDLTNELAAIIVLDHILSAQEREASLDDFIRTASENPNAPNITLPRADIEVFLADRMMKAWDRAQRSLPFREHAVSSIELDLRVCHNGIELHSDNKAEEHCDRFMNFVYFLHREPRRFSGGEMRICEENEDRGRLTLSGRSTVIHPLSNRIVFFQSWLPYEVLPTGYPTDDIADRLFTLRGWLRRES